MAAVTAHAPARLHALAASYRQVCKYAVTITKQ
jgi:hypothetical protein